MQVLSQMATLIALIITLLAIHATSQDTTPKVLNNFMGTGYYIQNNDGQTPPFQLLYHGMIADLWVCTQSKLHGDCVLLVMFNNNQFSGACTNINMYGEFDGKGIASWSLTDEVVMDCRGYKEVDCKGQWSGFARRSAWWAGGIKTENVWFAPEVPEVNGNGLKSMKCDFDLPPFTFTRLA